MVATRNQAATTIQATASRPKVTLASTAVARPPESPARPGARDLALFQYHLSVDEHVFDSDGGLVRPLERRAIDHRRRIENRDVGVHARLHEATMSETDALGGERRHLPNRELEREQLEIARVVAQNARERAVGARVSGLRAEWPVRR